VTSTGSLNQSMDKAVTHYSSLFWLPSYKKVILVLILVCVIGGLLSTFIFFPPLEGLMKGLLLGFTLFFTSLVIHYVVSVLILKRDPIYNVRRTAALSLYGWGLWLLFIFFGFVVALNFDLSWGVRLWLLGFSAVLIFRLVVFCSTSSVDCKRRVAASLLEPFSCVILFLMIWARMDYTVFLFLIFSFFVGLTSSFFFLFILNRVGNQTLGIASLSLFKAFLLNWVVDLNAPFEELLEKLGEKRDVEVFLVKFGSQKSKAVIAVPSIHPGPFKNIGSSLLPSMLKTALEKQLDCVASVLHGLLGHEFDLASQPQNQKIISHVIESANFEAVKAKATPFIKVSNGLAIACCQIFGDFAFLSLTLAPKTTEDLPQELGLFVRQEAEKQGLNCCIAVNAHNSIDGTVNTQEALDALKTVAATCLQNAASLKRLPFKIGAATVVPKNFGLRDGMGAGGITVTVVEVGKQKTAYVVIDGNNMVAGLREKILLALQSIGISEGEVFTTDTHSVNAVILGERGYHPIGEVIDHESLIKYIEEATLAAMSDLEYVKAACRSITIPDVKVIGEKLLEKLCLLIDRTLQKAKKVAVPIFALSGLLLMFILIFV